MDNTSCMRQDEEPVFRVGHKPIGYLFTIEVCLHRSILESTSD
jgi:hypothetical protein